MNLWHYALLVFFGGCCYGILSTFVKLAYAAGFTVTEVVGGQYFFGTMLTWIVVLFTKNNKLTIQQTTNLILSGIPFGLTGIFYYQSLQTLNASLAIIFLFQFVWIGTLFEWLFQKRKPTKRKLISITILLIGSILVTNILFQEYVTLSWQGSIWGLCAALTFYAFIFLSSSVEKETSPILKSALLSTGAVITVFIIFPPIFLFDLNVLTGLIPYGLALGVFGIFLPPLLFSIGMPHVGSGFGTILAASELPIAVSMSSLVLAEQVSWLQWTGVLIILLGIVNSNKGHMFSKQQSFNVEKSTPL